MSIEGNLNRIKEKLGKSTKLVAISKTKTLAQVMECYNAGQRIFGENKVQELVAKFEALPKDIEWHLVGHLQGNKVKFVAPFVSLIHSVDSLKLLQEINKQGEKCHRVISCLLQIYIAVEETKFGLDEEETFSLLESEAFKQLKNIRIMGVMGMATNTDHQEQ
ncbi:MAG: YggS family pyridoxal phosphate-dependent enzyme, partial [Bacteroidetes bacterium]|nr:YggS family pyridoxal phosphate-dependent enzyme [Bacteroidota bacterium]